MKVFVEPKDGMKDIADVFLLIIGWYDDKFFQKKIIKAKNEFTIIDKDDI
jgi:hypothetical protein